MDQELERPAGVIDPCARCRAKGVVVCPTCQGTGDIRNESYVVVDRCRECSGNLRGFITCPSCLGAKVVEPSQLRRSYRLEKESARSTPGCWGYKNHTFLSSLAPSSARPNLADLDPL